MSDKLHVSASVFYGFATGIASGSGSAGVSYGLATYGSADNNVTLGLGYGFGSFSSTPVGVTAANVRLARLFSLVNETYIATVDANGGLGCLAGLRYASPRFSGSLGTLYYTVPNDSGIYPAYLDVAYRFGKIKLR